MVIKASFKPSKIKESLIIDEDEVEEYEKKGYSIKRVKGQLRAFKELKKWEIFEAEIRKFLEILGFEKVSRSRVNLGGHEIDGIGGCDDTFLVIECTTKKEIKDGNVKPKLEKFNGWKNDIIKDVKKKYPTYSNIKFVFCTDFIVEGNAKKFAKKNNIYLWDYNYIKEYQSLYPFLGDSTKYHILFELGCKPRLTEEFSVPALRTKQRRRIIYNFFIEPEMLLRLAYVFRRTSSQRERAYQRPLKPGRIERIQKFLEEENGTFVNNIIINFKEKLNFKKFTSSKGLPNWLEVGIL